MRTFLTIAFIIGAIYLIGSFADKKSQQTSTRVTPTPTPTIPFALKQQCAEDANLLMNRLYQEENSNEQQVAVGGHTLKATYSLWLSTYSNTLNTCVAVINFNGSNDYKQLMGEEIYDTVSGKLLARHDYMDSKNNFIPGKFRTVTDFDYLDYKSSLGL